MKKVLWALALVGMFSLTSCGGGTSPSDQATLSKLTLIEQQLGISPNIAFQQMRGNNLRKIDHVTVVVQQRSGAVSKPVSFTYSSDYLIARGFLLPNTGELRVPMVGLYVARDNTVDIEAVFADASVQRYRIKVSTSALTGYALSYETPVMNRVRTTADTLGYDFFYIKAGTGAPVVVDTDGEVRWSGVGTTNASSSYFRGDSFFVGEQAAISLSRMSLDGDVNTYQLQEPEATSFHHDISAGKRGMLLELNGIRGGEKVVESILVESDWTGRITQRWDLGQIIGDYMTANGDTASLFVRPGVDWFHMNSAIYDARDDSLLVSSRENFIVKLDYSTGAIKWILGDPTKYWYSFPSLRAIALTITGSGWYPIGQHALSINTSGQLMVFNNGAQSFNSPAGAPPGAVRTTSVVSSYSINTVARTATEVARFDYSNSIYSQVCSSAYDSGDGSLLISYAMALNGRDARLVGVNQKGQVVFDLQYPANMCKGSWNAVPIRFEDMHLTAASIQ